MAVGAPIRASTRTHRIAHPAARSIPAVLSAFTGSEVGCGRRHRLTPGVDQRWRRAAAASTTGFVCNQNHTRDSGDILLQSRDIAVASAEAFARAVASISVDCYLSAPHPSPPFPCVSLAGRTSELAIVHVLVDGCRHACWLPQHRFG